MSDPVTIYTVHDGSSEDNASIVARFIPYGCTLVDLRIDDIRPLVTLPRLQDYLGDHPFVGSVVGRVANRIRNAQFELEGSRHTLPANDDGHTLHGGPGGFHTRIWDVETISTQQIAFRYVSPNGEEGFPGELDTTITVTAEMGRLHIDYTAITDAPTPVSLTHHPYFNLSDEPTIDGHGLQLYADTFTRTDADKLPTDYYADPEGTPFDRRYVANPIGEAVMDHNLIHADLERVDTQPHARLTYSNRELVVSSTLPAVQIYTGEALASAGLHSRGGIAIEPQFPPDWVNAPKDLQSSLGPAHHTRPGTVAYAPEALSPPNRYDIILRPGQTYHHRTTYEAIELDESLLAGLREI